MSADMPATLRRTIVPYIGQGMILSGVTVLLLGVALKKQQWDLLWAAVLIWGLYASYVLLFGIQYRIIWDDASVKMTASGGPAKRILFEEITEVRYETASRDEFLAQARPFRRIVILGNQQDPKDSIDVSLRHFRTEDIEGLLMAIHRCRPDIKIPRIRPIDKS